MSEFEFYEEREGKVYARTSSGWEVECMPVGDLLLRVGSALSVPKEPTPPTYTVTDASGDKSDHVHDEESIKDPKTTEEEKIAWADYLVEKAQYESEMEEVEEKRRKMRGRFMAIRGIRVVNLPDLEKWADEQRDLYGFEIPDDPRERLVEFVNTEIIRTQADGNSIVIGIYKASGMDEEVLSSIEDRFRASMGRTEGSDTETDPETSPEGERREEEGVVGGSDLEKPGSDD